MNLPPVNDRYSQQPKRTNTTSVVLIVVGVVFFICIAGIGVLSAILYPVFKQAKQSATRAVCLSNVKQLSTSILMYSADFDDKLPAATTWMDSTLKITERTSTRTKPRSQYRCPVVSQNKKEDEYGYAFNERVKGSMSSLGDPQNIPLVFDSINLKWNAYGAIDLLPNPSRHRLNNVGFCDGHVKGLKPGVSIQ
jgi:prepilin-type processing-associated H-X9-DG protein